MARGSAMLQSSAAGTTAYRVRVAVAIGLVVSLVSLRGIGQQPAPVQPLVPAPGIPPLSAVPTVAKPSGQQAPDEIPELSLGECIAIAIEHQPSLRAMRSSQEATAAGQRALSNIHPLASFVSPDLPIRKAQSAEGVIAAAADLQKLHNEVVHDVTRLYYTVVYARQQSLLADDIVAQMETFVDIAKKLLNSATPGDMTQAKLDLMLIAQGEILELQAEAQAGFKQANAALREAMGVADGSLRFAVKDKELPIMAQNVPLSEDQVVAMALERRPELALAAAAADAFRLEVYAQGQLRFRRTVPTLGAASDIHSRLLPSGSRDPGHDYRPEPIPPEMPPNVVGTKVDRVARVLAYSHRMDDAYDKVRGLMILEARKSYTDFEKAKKRMAAARDGFRASKSLMDRVREQFDNPKAPKDQLLLGYGQAAKGQARYVEAVFQYLLTLGALERVTAGAVRPAFPGR
jgi:hypothetical protein